jgi:peptide chain release factor
MMTAGLRVPSSVATKGGSAVAELVNLLVTSGSGPEECRIAVAYLSAEMTRQAKRMGLQLHCLRDGDQGPPKSMIVTVSGEGAEQFIRPFLGSIKLVFKSPVRPGHGRSNWFVGVERLENDFLNTEVPQINLSDVRFDTLRAGGPGGQHVNTTDSAVRAVHIPTGLSTLARDERSQHRNKSLAVQRLSAMLQLIADGEKEKGKRQVFLTHKSLERGNEVMTLKI